MPMVRVHHRLPKFLRPLRLTGEGARLRTLILAFDSPGGHHFVRPSSNWRGRGPPKAEIPVRPRMAGPCGPVGEMESPVPCHGTDRRFKSGQARQVLQGAIRQGQKPPSQGGQAGSLPAHLAITPNSTGVQRAVFQAAIGGFDSRRRDQMWGSQSWLQPPFRRLFRVRSKVARAHGLRR
jgi:hypothetical protein